MPLTHTGRAANPEAQASLDPFWQNALDAWQGKTPLLNGAGEPYVAPVLDFSKDADEQEFDEVAENLARIDEAQVYVAPTIEGLIQNEVRAKRQAKREPNYGGDGPRGAYVEAPYIAPTLF